MLRTLLVRLVYPLLLVAGILAAGCSPDPVLVEEDRRAATSKLLIQALRDSEDPAARLRAVIAMGRIQSAAYVSALARAAGDDDRDVRLAVLFAMGQMGLVEGARVHPTAYRVCVDALQDQDPAVIATALEALGKLAWPQSASIILRHLAHPSSEVRVEAALALFRLRFVPVWRKTVQEPEALSPQAVSALISAIDDADDAVRRAAVYAFSRYGQPEAAGKVATLVGDPDEWTRLFAIRALGRSGEATPLDAVRAGLDDASPRVRTEAVAALAALGQAEGYPRALVDDPSFHVRTALAAALAGSTSPAGLETLRSLERDPSPTVRAAAIGALARRLKSGYEAALRRHLEDESWTSRVAAARAAGVLGERGLALIEIAMRDEDARVRAASLEEVGSIEGADPLILEALASADLATRATAVARLAERDHPQKLERLTEVYDDSAGLEWVEVREAVAEALADLDRGAPLLWKIGRTDPARSVRDKALRVLRDRKVSLPPPLEFPYEVSPLLGRTFRSDPTVILETTKGEIRIRCFAGDAPVHVANFVKLVREGFYDGLIWHRVVSNFVVQGGDPRGDGWGNPGYTIRDEINTRRYGRGAVGMPKAGKDTGGCQIFVTHVPTPHLDGNYTVFGQVVSGMEVVDQIEVSDSILRARLE